MDLKYITSSGDAVNYAYRKVAGGFGTVTATALAFYINAQMISERYVPGGVWNTEAYSQDWGTDGRVAFVSLCGAAILGVVSLAGGLGIPQLVDVRNQSRIVTKVDIPRKKITQAYSNGDEVVTEYDAVLSVKVRRGWLQKRSDIGDLEVTVMSLVNEGGDHPLNLGIVESTVYIPLQKNPQELGLEIVRRLPPPAELKQKLQA